MNRVREALARRREELLDRWDRQLRAAAEAGFALDSGTAEVLPHLLDATDRSLERLLRKPQSRCWSEGHSRASRIGGAAKARGSPGSSTSCATRSPRRGLRSTYSADAERCPSPGQSSSSTPAFWPCATASKTPCSTTHCARGACEG